MTSSVLPPHAKIVFAGEIFSVWQWPQELYDGSTATFEALKRPDTVHTIGVLPDGKILLTEDEQPNRPAVITPAGGVVNTGEPLQDAAHREFLEETGYQIGSLIAWHSYQPSSKIEWTVYAFIGKALKKTGPAHPDPGEKIKILTFTFDEFLELGHNPKMRDNVIRLILLEAKLDKNKRKDLYNLLYA